MKILITICARGGSKGIPGKNIKPIKGIPLIAYSIRTAKKFAEHLENDTQIGLSTDSMDIKNICVNYGLDTEYWRKKELATDSIGKIDVIRDILEWYEQTNHTKYDYILDLDVTSPLRTVSDLNNALSIIQSDPEALNLFSVSSAKKNPYFNMVEQKDNGYFGLVKNGNEYLTRQSAPKVYELNASFYFYRRTFFEKGYKSTITDRSLIYEVPHICFDLDHPVDFDFLSFLIENNKLDFEL